MAHHKFDIAQFNRIIRYGFDDGQSDRFYIEWTNVDGETDCLDASANSMYIKMLLIDAAYDSIEIQEMSPEEYLKIAERERLFWHPIQGSIK